MTYAITCVQIVPGVTLREVFNQGWDSGFEGNLQIGRTPPLSSDKSRSHFPILRERTGVEYAHMLFFDDCNWGDHVSKVLHYITHYLALSYNTPHLTSHDPLAAPTARDSRWTC
jgi:hypothetical protein